MIKNTICKANIAKALAKVFNTATKPTKSRQILFNTNGRKVYEQVPSTPLKSFSDWSKKWKNIFIQPDSASNSALDTWIRMNANDNKNSENVFEEEAKNFPKDEACIQASSLLCTYLITMYLQNKYQKKA